MIGPATCPELRPGETVKRADEVRKGDLVVASTIELDGRTLRLDHSTLYAADPQPDKPGCGCFGHQALDDEDRARPCVVLYAGPLWDWSCDVVPADALVIVRVTR